MKKHMAKILCFGLALSILAACQPQAPAPKGVKIGKPYVIDGKTYYPSYDPTYDRIGQASWYGPGFHGKYTANGERFDQNDLTAAHPTLPMPSLVRVTNLESGKSVILRINDRGPFKNNRIIDLSKKSAQTLGVHSLARVRVQFLKEESERYVAALQSSGKILTMAEFNAAEERMKNASVTRSTEPGPQIVESTVSTSHAGQAISNAAPVMTVSSDELATPGTVENKELPKLFKDAAAEEAPPAAASQPSPVVIHANETITETTHKPAPEPAEAKPAAGQQEGRYVIQAGSFAAEENAHKLESRLAGIANVFIDKVEMGDKEWWRVRVGKFSDKASADAALAKVRAAGVPDARIVQ